MKKIEKLKRLIEFMNIPVIDGNLTLKIREWEELFAPEIHEFRSMRQRFGLTADEHLYNEPFKTLQEQKTLHTFRFIKAANPGKGLKDSWTLESIRPPLDEYEHTGVLQTDEFLKLLEESPAAPKFSKRIFAFPDRDGKSRPGYKIWLQKATDRVVVGMICLLDSDDGYFPFSSRDTGDNLPGKKIMEQKIGENMYLELFRFMEENPEAREHIFFYFRSVLKPNALLKEKIPAAKL